MEDSLRMEAYLIAANRLRGKMAMSYNRKGIVIVAGKYYKELSKQGWKKVVLQLQPRSEHGISKHNIA